jgi:cytochrome oxidase assembly protein ShyY1
VLRSALTTLRQPRYAALSALMGVVALVCIAAGTWQIVRFEGKVTANDDLRGNAHAAPVPVATLLPLTTAAAPAKDGIELHTVTATGTYDEADQVLVRGRSVNGRDGYLVLTPLTTDQATLLVVRGFVQERANGDPLPAAAAPSGVVAVSARVVQGESKDEGLTKGTVAAINPAQQAKRLDRPMYDGFAELLAKQPGTAGLTVMPDPDLSNPAGGAVEPQHFAYIIQWYLFALLALAAPFAMARADSRELRAAGVRATPRTPEEARAARLADRYGRPVKS